MSANLSQAIRGFIIGMWRGGASSQKIANQVGCSLKTVRRWIKKYQEGGLSALSDHRRKNGGKPRKTSLAQDLALVQYMAKHPFHSARRAAIALGLPISDSTVRRRLHGANIHCYPVARRMPVRRRYRDRRDNFSNQEFRSSKMEEETAVMLDEMSLSYRKKLLKQKAAKKISAEVAEGKNKVFHVKTNSASNKHTENNCDKTDVSTYQKGKKGPNREKPVETNIKNILERKSEAVIEILSETDRESEGEAESSLKPP